MTIAFIAWLAVAPGAAATAADGEIVIRPPGQADVALATRDTVAEVRSRMAERFDTPLEAIATLRADYTACLQAAEQEGRQTALNSCHVAMLDGRIGAINTITAALGNFETDLGDLQQLYRQTRRGFDGEIETLRKREAEIRTAEDALLDALEDLQESGALEDLTPEDELKVKEVIIELEIHAMEMAHIERERSSVSQGRSKRRPCATTRMSSSVWSHCQSALGWAARCRWTSSYLSL